MYEYGSEGMQEEQSPFYLAIHLTLLFYLPVYILFICRHEYMTPFYVITNMQTLFVSVILKALKLVQCPLLRAGPQAQSLDILLSCILDV